MGSKYVAAPPRNNYIYPGTTRKLATMSNRCSHTNMMVIDRTFLAESRLILAKIVYAFELSLVNPEDKDWPDNRAWLAYEPKALMVTLKERTR